MNSDLSMRRQRRSLRRWAIVLRWWLPGSNEISWQAGILLAEHSGTLRISIVFKVEASSEHYLVLIMY